MPRIPTLLPAVLAFALVPLAIGHRDLSLRPQEPSSVPVMLTVTVTDKHGNYVRDLRKNAFEVLDNNKPQQITEFAEQDSPAAVGIVFALSGSINSDTIRSRREALANLVGASHPNTEFFLVGINDQPQLRQDWTRDAVTLTNALPIIPPKTKMKGYTAFYDACYFSIAKLISTTNRKRVLLIVSDGEDNNSKHTFRELERLLETTGVVLYAVGAFSNSDPGSALGLEGKSILDELSSVTGGTSYYPKKPSEIGTAFTNIGTELRNQYSLAFQPEQRLLANAKRHSLKVKIAQSADSQLALRDLKMRTRHGYYPPTNK